MRRDTLFLGLSIFGLILTGKAFASFGPSGWNPGSQAGDQPPGNTDLPPQDTGAPLDAKIAAFLALIRQYESGNDYYILNGGAHFTDTSAHPGRIVPPGTSTAAGAYQITYGTWQDFAPGAGAYDFSPISQDQVAYVILDSTGAVDRLAADDLVGAIVAASRRWLALKTNSQAELVAAYNDNLAFA